MTERPKIPTSIMLGVARGALLDEIANTAPQVILDAVDGAVARMKRATWGRAASAVAMASALEPLLPGLSQVGGFDPAGCLFVWDETDAREEGK